MYSRVSRCTNIFEFWRNRCEEKNMRWTVIDGNFSQNQDDFTYSPSQRDTPIAAGKESAPTSIGLIIGNERFTGGDIEAEVVFSEITDNNAAEIVAYFDPNTRTFLSAGIGGAGTSFFIRHWNGQWTYHGVAGNKSNLQQDVKYDLKLASNGNNVSLWVNEVNVLSAQLPFSLPPSQTGMHFIGEKNVQVSNYRVAGSKGKAFIVMEFGTPFDEIYIDVISEICSEFDIDALRADDTYGPGLIIADVIRDIVEADFIVAEVTPKNPNVYYEIGYAHAINKPTILLADKNLDRLPFDIAGFRTLFYENTISGKRKFEDGLRKHIAAILQKSPIPRMTS